MRTGTTVVHAHYTQFQIVDEGGDLPVSYPDFDLTKLLCVADSPGGALVFTGAFYGSVTVTVAVHDDMPAVAAGWDEVTEDAYTTSTGTFGVGGWGMGPSPELPIITVAPGTRFGLRVHGKGRERGREYNHRNEPVPEGVEEYLIEFWPAKDGGE